ncbi:MAG: hypothetical protein ACK533_11800 [Planctomycetota bacterium]
MRVFALAAVLGVVAALAGCSPFGPATIPAARFDYNQTIARSWDEQLLLNLVRLRYRDTPQFLQIGSVLARYSRVAGADAGVAGGADGTSRPPFPAGVNGAVAETPTITSVPLQGEEFTRHLLRPIGVQPLFLLARSGWSIERLLRCCVQQINGLPNAPSCAGPTPTAAPDTAAFRALAKALRGLQVEGVLGSLVDGVDDTVATPGAPPPRFLLGNDDPRVADLRRMMALDGSCREFPVETGLGAGSGCSIVLQTRSLLGVMFFLSLGVEAPERDLALGLVTTTLDAAGRQYDWKELVGDLLRVRHADERPPTAYVAVPYRGSWWYIDDADLDSKSTFFLLTWLFNLQASNAQAIGPMLTVGAGR